MKGVRHTMKIIANKGKPLIELARFDIRRFLRLALVLILYLITYSLLDQLTYTLQLFPGVVAWYPPDGLSLAFLLTFGAGFTPAVTLASLISSLIIYRFSTPLGPLLVWAVILSAVYGINALLLRRRIRIDPQLKNLRDTLWLILTSAIVSTVLAVISVSNLINYGEVPASQYFNAFVQWWIGEMIGVLVFSPFLLIHVMPWLKRFMDGGWTNSRTRYILHRPSFQTIGQVISIPVTLYLVFGIPALSGFQPFYLIAWPLIWIALTNGFSRVSLAIVVMNFGTILAIWLFKFDTSRLGEFQFPMFGIYISALLTGAIVTKQKRIEEVLRQREVHNRALIENAPDAITLLGTDGLLKYLSPSTQQILGYAPEEQMGSNPAEFTHPDDLPALLKLLDDLGQEPGKVVTTQYRFRHKDGSWRWLESTITNLLAEPSVQAIVFNFRDITERKQADETLQKSEKRFRALVEHSLEEISLVDSDGTLTYESPTSRRPLGYPPDSLVGYNILDLFHPDDRAAAAQLLEQSAKHPGSVKEASFRLRHQDGSWRWMEGSLNNLLDEPAVQSVVINYRDVTERKRDEEALRRSQEETSLANRLLLALSHAAQAVQRAHTIEEVYSAIQDQVTQMGYSASGFELSEDSRSLRIAYLSYKADLVHIAEKMIGFSLRNFRFHPRADSVYQKVIGKGETVFVKNSAQVVADTLPEKLRILAQPMADLFKLGPSIFTPLIVDDKAIGLMVFTGPDLTEADTPAITAFASQAAIAIQNARLYEQAQREIAERKQAEQEIVNLAKFPSENPNPVLRLSRDGIVLFANAASSVLMRMWGCAVGDTAPRFWCDLAAQALANKENKTVDIECDGKIYEMFVTPFAEPAYVNLYGLNITARKKAEEEIKISNDELSMLFTLSHSLAEADNLDDILSLANRHAVESVHTTFARIALMEDENYIIRAAYPLRVLDHDFRIGDRNPVTSIPYSQRILDQNEPMILRASDPGISDEEKKAILLDFAQTLCLIPLRINDSSLMSEKLIGLLMLGEARNEGREPFTPEKMRLAQTIGDSAAIAIRRMLLREQTERHLQQLIALSEIDLAIISSSDMVFSLGVLLLQAIEKLKVDAADVWLFNPAIQALELVTSRGFRTPAFENAKPLNIGESYVGGAALERRTIHVPNLTATNDNPRLTKALAEEPFISYYAVPLIVKEQLKGVLELFHRTELDSNEEWLKFLQALANQAAIAIDNSSLFNDLQHSNAELTQAYDATIQGWSRALDLRDNETEGHTQRVTELTMKLWRQFGLSEEELVHVRRGALLHDIGKMGVPDGILLKPGPLTDEEWIVMRKHTTFAYELLSPIHFLQPALDIPYCHHEKWDGTGYPRGLSGDQIPIAARIFAVIDVWDALTSDRPYRAAWSEEKVLDHIRSLAGTHFDPQVVKICLESSLLNG